MNYLLIQILLCLFIAGLIGLVIGWFLRGMYKNKLLHRYQESNINLNENNNRWSEKVEVEKKRQDNTIDALKEELTEVKKRLMKAEIKNRGAQTIKEEAKVRLKEMETNYSNKLEQLSKELSITKQQLAIVIQETQIPHNPN